MIKDEEKQKRTEGVEAKGEGEGKTNGERGGEQRMVKG